jgi:hypothetical protein
MYSGHNNSSGMCLASQWMNAVCGQHVWRCFRCMLRHDLFRGLTIRGLSSPKRLKRVKFVLGHGDKLHASGIFVAVDSFVAVARFHYGRDLQPADGSVSQLVADVVGSRRCRATGYSCLPPRAEKTFSKFHYRCGFRICELLPTCSPERS